MIRLLAIRPLAMVVLCVSACTRAVSSDVIDERFIATELEPRLMLPEHAAALDRYARFYTPTTHDGVQTIEGTLVRLGGYAPGVHLVPLTAHPSIDDGGCSVVTLRFEVRKRAILWARCNGVG